MKFSSYPQAIMRIKADHLEYNELKEDERLWDYPRIEEPRVEFMFLDLSLLESVQQFINQFKIKNYPVIIHKTNDLSTNPRALIFLYYLSLS